MFGDMMGEDRNWLAAGIVAAVLIPALVFGVGLPLIIALVAGGAVFVGALFLLAPRKLFEGINVSKLTRGQLDVVRRVMEEAKPALARLEAAGATIKSAKIRETVNRLAKTARTIMDGLEQNPERLSSVQRFLTYYLPSSAEISESYSVLEQQRAPEVARVKQTEAVIAKLDDAFSHYADSLHESDLSNLDVELRLIDAAVKEDIRSAP
jgi:5-bromo-4-chloroindolyl phosphate hydrolysis protein